MFFLFAALVASTFFLLLIWAGATVYRLYHPENPRPFGEPSFLQRETPTAKGERVPVGIREIRADQRRKRRKQNEGVASYTWGRSEGVPDPWFEDLWRRRN